MEQLQDLIDVLRGSKARKVIENGADTLSVHGIGMEYSREGWKHLALQFLQHELLNRDSQHGSLRLTRKGWAVLRDKEQFWGFPVDSANHIAEEPNDGPSKEPSEYNHALFEAASHDKPSPSR